MIARRVLSSGYLVSGVWISIAIATAFGSAFDARAQANPNLQNQLNILSPPVVTVVPSTTEVTEVTAAEIAIFRANPHSKLIPAAQGACRLLTDKEIERIARLAADLLKRSVKATSALTKFTSALSENNHAKIRGSVREIFSEIESDKKKTEEFQAALAAQPIKYNCNGQPTMFTTSSCSIRHTSWMY